MKPKSVGLFFSVFCCALGVPEIAHAQLDFQFNLEPGSGFLDPTPAPAGSGFATIGELRENTLNAVGDYLGSLFENDGRIEIDVTAGSASEAFSSDTLASAGPFFPSGEGPGFSLGAAAFEGITGFDPFGGVAGGELTVNFDGDFTFNEGLDSPAANEFDLFSVLLHEFGHVLGFLSVIEADGTSGFDDSPGLTPIGGDPGLFSITDALLVDADGDPLFAPGGPGGLFDPVTGVPFFIEGGDFIGDVADLAGGPGSVFFAGPNVVAANGGEPLPVYTPTTFQLGSSLSHLDETQPGLEESVLGPTIAPGDEFRTFLPVELALFADIGFTLATPAAVPEPSSALLLLGAGLIAGSARHRAA